MYKEFAVYVTGIYMLIAVSVAVVLYLMEHPTIFVLAFCALAFAIVSIPYDC